MLTDAQKVERKKGIGASDGAKIVSGDWWNLWAEKTNRQESPEILSQWDQLVRHALEPLVMDQYEKDYGHPVIERGAAIVCPEYPIMRCTLDGFDDVLKKPVDAKALNMWTKDEVQWCIDHYSTQMQHQMLCKGSQVSSLYVSMGMKKPFEIHFQRDDFFLTDYVAKCKEFWGYVERDEEPPQGKPMVVGATPPDRMRVEDFSKDNTWVSSAADWLENKDASKKFDDAAKALRAKVEGDVREASGGGVTVSRSKDNKLLIKATKEKK